MTAVAASLAALLLSTEVPSGLLPTGGGSAALAELLARSPGARVGGFALKAKDRRAALAPLAAAAPAAEAAPGNAFASVLGASAGPEGAIPATGPIGPGGFPTDFIAPGVPVPATAPGGSAATPGAPGFAGLSPPVGGSLPVVIPGSGGGGGGGGGVIGPNPSETPGPQPTDTVPIPQPTDTVPGVVSPIPEPSAWLMLIAGFGFIGGAMRRGRRAALA